MIGMIKAKVGDQLWFIGSGDHNPVRVKVITPYENFAGDLYVELEEDLNGERMFLKSGQTMGVSCSEVRWPTGQQRSL